MKIKKIAIEGFKGIEKMEYVPNSKIGTLIAPNGSGKTSFFQAMESLFGNTNKDKVFIREGCPIATISVTTEGNTYERILSREKQNKFRADNKYVTEAEFYDALMKETKMKAEDFRVLSSSELFEKLSSQELADYLNAKVNQKLTMDDLVDFLPADFPEDAFLALENKLGYEFGPAELSGLYSDFYATRRNYNRMLKEQQSKCNEISKPNFSKEDLQKAIKEVEEMISAAKANKIAKEEYEKAVKTYQLMANQKSELEEKVKKAHTFEPKKEDLEKAKADKKAVQEQMMQVRNYCSTIKSNMGLFKKTLDNLNTNICPISEKLVCSTDKTKIKGELEASIAKNKQILAIGDKKYAELKVYEDALTKQIEVLQDSFSKYQNYMNLKKQLSAFKLPEKPIQPKTKVIDEDLLSMKRADIDMKKKALEDFEAYTKAKAECEKVSIRAKLYDALVKVTDPKGTVVKKVLEKYFAVFNDEILKTTQAMSVPFTVKLIVDNGVKCVFRKDNMARDYVMLSNGEKVIVTMIILNAINRVAGNKMLFIDNLNELDESNQEKVLSFIEALVPDYDNVFVASATDIALPNADCISLEM